MEPEERAENVSNWVDSIYDTMRDAKAELVRCDGELNDLRHALELQSLGKVEMRQNAERQRDVLRLRRVAKETIEILMPVIDMYEKNSVKRTAEMAAKAAHNVANRQERRVYNPRVRVSDWDGQEQNGGRNT